MSEELNNKNEVENEVSNEDLINSLGLVDSKKDQEKGTSKNIQDININNLDDVLVLLDKNAYDFVTIEPNDSEVALNFRKNDVIIETKYIKFHVYSNILLKAKTITKLKVIDVTDIEQEGSGETLVGESNYKLIVKVASGNFGEKIFIKSEKIKKDEKKKDVQKISTTKIVSFLISTALVALIVGGSFLTFIVLNAKTATDVAFFSALGISLNEINAFIAKLATTVFSVLMLVEIILMIVFLFKFFLTPKEFKKKKITFGILSAILLISTLSTFAAWMVVDQKIKSLPNWQVMVKGSYSLYDNNKYINSNFAENLGIITDTKNLIGPIDIRFDLSPFVENERAKGNKIKTFTWEFVGNNINETETTTETYKIKTFNQIDSNISIKITAIGTDAVGKDIENVIEIPSISISYVVGIKEENLKTGGKKIEFNASSLEKLGKISWYDVNDLEKPLYSGNVFIPSKPVFDDTMFLMKIDNNSSSIEKLFIVNGKSEVNIDGKIEYEATPNDLEMIFRVVDIQNSAGFIETYKWKIDGKEYTRTIDQGSQITHKFSNYGEYEVSVELVNSLGETRTLELFPLINIQKPIKINSGGLKVLVDGKEIQDMVYNSSLNEYLVGEVGIPSKITFDTKNLKLDTISYVLGDIKWDFDSNGDIDASGKVGNYDINSEGNYTITVHITIVDRRDDKNTKEIVQKILVEAVQKKAEIDFEIIKDTDYVPTSVKFDGTKSYVKNENIVKFIWDYGDGYTEEVTDGVILGHMYTKEGDYKVTLTVVTENISVFSRTKNLVLTSAPQTVKIKSSLKKSVSGQSIDFSSEGSQGQVSNYYWDFGDGESSTLANPTHVYTKSGKYKVILKLEFVATKRILEDSIEIEIY